MRILWVEGVMLDLAKAGSIEFEVDNTGKVWINLDGRCIVRIGRVEHAAFIGMELADECDVDSNVALLSWGKDDA
jgi:hypothetical protein